MVLIKRIQIVNAVNLIEPSEAISTDWFGAPHAYQPRYSIFETSSDFIFTVEVNKTPYCASEVKEYSWHEGLWEYDVAEIFFGLPDTRYVEFNLAPNGANWAQWFSAYRKRDNNGNEKLRSITSVFTQFKEKWCATLTIPKHIFSTLPEVAHVSFILHEDTPIFFSSNPVAGEPDFHNSECFSSLEYES